MALCNYTGLVASRLSLYNVCFHFTRFCVLDVLPVGLVRKLQYQFTIGIENLQGLGKIWPRVEVSTYQHRGGRTCHEKTKVWSAEAFVWYGDLLLAFYNYHGLVAPRLSLYNFCFLIYSFCLCSGFVPCSSSAHRVPGDKSTVPIYKVLVRPGREARVVPSTYQERTERTYH